MSFAELATIHYIISTYSAQSVFTLNIHMYVHRKRPLLYPTELCDYIKFITELIDIYQLILITIYSPIHTAIYYEHLFMLLP